METGVTYAEHPVQVSVGPAIGSEVQVGAVLMAHPRHLIKEYLAA